MWHSQLIHFSFSQKELTYNVEDCSPRRYIPVILAANGRDNGIANWNGRTQIQEFRQEVTTSVRVICEEWVHAAIGRIGEKVSLVGGMFLQKRRISNPGGETEITTTHLLFVVVSTATYDFFKSEHSGGQETSRQNDNGDTTVEDIRRQGRGDSGVSFQISPALLHQAVCTCCQGCPDNVHSQEKSLF